MKPNEIRNLTLDEIGEEVNKRREELFNLRLQASISQLNNPRRIRNARREVARLLTVAEQKMAAQKEAQA